MKEKIFNDIYNQYTPDKKVVNRLFERIEKEKPKTVPFKPIIAAASTAAGFALCFAAWKLLPSGPNIEVQTPAALTTTAVCTTAASYKSNVIIYDTGITFETPPGATTAPAYGPETEGSYKSNVITYTLPTNDPDAEWIPALDPDIDLIPATSSIPENPAPTVFSLEGDDITADSQLPVVTAASFAETTTVTEAIITTTEITTMPPASESKEDVEEDADIAAKNVPEMQDMPVFDTLGEYFEYFRLSYNSHTVTIGFEVSANGFISFNNKKMDAQFAEETAALIKDYARNDDAPIKGEKRIRYINMWFNGSFSIYIYENGTVVFSAFNYDGDAKFTTDPSVYDMLYEYAMSFDGDSPIYHIGENDDGSDSVDEVPPEDENPVTT